MRISISIFLIIAHFISITGLYANIHECGGDLSYSFYGISCTDGCTCDHEDEEHKKDDCCKDKKIQIKGKTDNAICKYKAANEPVAVLYSFSRISFFQHIDRLPEAIKPLIRLFYPPPSYIYCTGISGSDLPGIRCCKRRGMNRLFYLLKGNTLMSITVSGAALPGQYLSIIE